jgi:hypothetical protein
VKKPAHPNADAAPADDGLPTAADAMADWDARFWAPSKTLCENCMPPELAAEVRRIRENARGPVGKSGPTYCAQCGKER